MKEKNIKNKLCYLFCPLFISFDFLFKFINFFCI